MNKLYIFGAHSRARTTAKYLTYLDNTNKLLAYLIDNDEDNEDEIGGIPVIDIRGECDLDITASVYLGMRGVNFESATKTLEFLGFSNIYPVDVRMDAELRIRYFRKRFEAEGRTLVLLDEVKSEAIVLDSDVTENVCIFEVRSAYDNALTKDTYVREYYEKSIQVGAALTNVILSDCEYRDNEGDNISATNRQFCEVTALYWMWKHSDYDIVGLVHYRRHFLMPNDWLKRMIGNEVDIILPIPLYIEPSVEENYRFRHISSDWDYMLEFMSENHKDQMGDVRKCFNDTYYYPCNMFVMKREIFEEYCTWLFPILFYVMEKVGSRDDVYQNRYPAFMAERLLTLFCYIHRDRYKVVSVDKNFLE